VLKEKRRAPHEEVIMSKGFDSPSIKEKETKSKRLKAAVDAESVQQQWLSQFSKLNEASCKNNLNNQGCVCGLIA
jgi:hypothetical protein